MTPCRVGNGNKCLTIISANLRGFRTNIGDLTHSYIIPNRADIVATVETFLDDDVPSNYGKISGYTNWHRRDRIGRQKGGIAICFRENLRVQPLEVEVPCHLELSFFKIWLNSTDTILFCTCYRPQWQNCQPIEYLKQNLDALLGMHSCKHLAIVGDMNQNLIMGPFEEFLSIFGLYNHVTFPTHDSGSSLDPVITDIPEALVHCCSLGNAGSSDHKVIHTTINICPQYDEPVTRTQWLWKKGDWGGFRNALAYINWESIMTGDIDKRVQAFTKIVLTLQEIYIPNRTYIAKPKDQPWFGYQCRLAADNKSRVWNRYKLHPTNRNFQLHKDACNRMRVVQQWAINRWQRDIKSKLTDKDLGGKEWWGLMKQQQGICRDETVPPLTRDDGTVAVTSAEKAELLASFFADKMSILDPHRAIPMLDLRTNARLCTLQVKINKVEHILRNIDINKAIGPDNISPYILKRCATQLAPPLACIFNTCINQRKWPKIWKQARVVAVHKKKTKTKAKNYRPISLLSVVSKVFEKIICTKITKFLDKHHLLSIKQFGFRKERSASDLLLKMTTLWNRSLDMGEETYVIALDIAGAFDRVWHDGLIVKIKSLGISGDLLGLLSCYLRDREFQVVLGGQSSGLYKIGASVPQGSVLGPLFWNIYFNDLLQLIPGAHAYADDCTIGFPCKDGNHLATINHINETLKLIISWSKKWQVSLAPEKTQMMLISRKLRSDSFPEIMLGKEILLPDSSINILGVQFDNKLAFTHHVKDLATKAAKKLSCIRRVAKFLDQKGCISLYKSQVRSLMEYSPLSWASCPPSYLQLLDKIQDRAVRLASSRTNDPSEPMNIQPLRHRRDVAGLCTFYKIHILNYQQLSSLKLESSQVITATRDGDNRCGHEVIVPFARTESFLRSFHPYFSRLWNRVIRFVDARSLDTIQKFKTTVNKLLLDMP